jgi:hypothetical protein
MGCGWNLKNQGGRKSEALGGGWVRGWKGECWSRIWSEFFSQRPKRCFESGGVMKKDLTN